MKHLIVGTAGHVDHGKTALIRALTGVDTDRLAEEKRRGITIELGFAQLALSESVQVGMIDMPGHERFIRNMLVGAGAVDLVLMTVAADEGVMPQTREHLDILSLLGTKQGIVVLTKCDLVDSQLLTLVRQEVQEAFADSFLAQMPMVEVSSKTGEGIERLREQLLTMAQNAARRKQDAPFWLAVDRVFTKDGFGVIATGTLSQGTLRVGDLVCVSPAGETARVRGLQTGGREIGCAVAGERVAVNLSGIKKETIARGAVLTVMQNSVERIDVKLSLLKHSKRSLTNGMQLHLAIGTASVVCRAVILQSSSLKAGEEGYLQLRLQVPVAAQVGERFVVRFFSPLETIGGGVVLDIQPKMHGRLDRMAIERLKLYETGTLKEQLLYEMTHARYTEQQLFRLFAHRSSSEIAKACQLLTAQGQLSILGKYLVTPAYLAYETERLLVEVSAFHADFPLSDGIAVAQLYPHYPRELVEQAVQCGRLHRIDAAVALFDFSPYQTELYRQVSRRLAAVFADEGYTPPDLEEALHQCGCGRQIGMRVIELLVADGSLVRISPTILLCANACEQVKMWVREAIEREGGITLARLRDILGTSRKYAQAILEYFDVIGYTKKDGDVRTFA